MTLGKVPDPVFTYRYHTDGVQCCRFVGKNQQNILSGSVGGDVCYWSNQTHKILSFLSKCHQYGLVSVDRVGEQLMLSHGRDGLIQIYDTELGLSNVINTIQAGDLSYIQCRSVHEDPSLYITAASPTKGNIAVWDLREPSKTSLELSVNLQEEGMILASQLFSISSYFLFSVSDAGNCLIHDLRSPHSPLLHQNIQNSSLFTFDYDPVLNQGFCAGSSSLLSPFTVNWDSNSLVVETPIQMPNSGISSICIRPDHKIVATGGWDSKVRLFQIKNRKPLAVLNAHRNSVTCVDFSNQNDFISSSQDTRLFLWDLYKYRSCLVYREEQNTLEQKL